MATLLYFKLFAPIIIFFKKKLQVRNYTLKVLKAFFKFFWVIIQNVLTVRN